LSELFKFVPGVQTVDGRKHADGGLDSSSNDDWHKAFWSGNWADRIRKDDVTKFEREVGLKDFESVEELVRGLDLSEDDVSAYFVVGLKDVVKFVDLDQI